MTHNQFESHDYNSNNTISYQSIVEYHWNKCTISLFKKLRKQRVKHNAKHCVIKELHSLLNLFCIETFPMPRHDYGIERVMSLLYAPRNLVFWMYDVLILLVRSSRPRPREKKNDNINIVEDPSCRLRIWSQLNDGKIEPMKAKGKIRDLLFISVISPN